MSAKKKYTNPDKAVDALTRLYEEQASKLVASWQDLANGKEPNARIRALYPQISVHIDSPPVANRDRTMAYGFCVNEGIYTNTFTRPDLFGDYYRDQLTQIMINHPDAEMTVGLSKVRMPVTFAVNEKTRIEGTVRLTTEQVAAIYDVPDHKSYEHDTFKLKTYPLSRYNAPRTDRAMDKIRHYTGTNPQFFQRYVLFANYDDYIELFKKKARSILADDQSGKAENPFIAFVSPGNMIEVNDNVPDVRAHFEGVHSEKPKRKPQMEAYHLVRKDGSGITIVNIGVGATNANTITDEIAVLRPQAWLMVGHCAGLSYNQQIGDYAIPNSFVLKDGVVDKKLGPNVPIPEISEIHRSMTDAIQTVLGVERDEYRSSVRSGVVTTVANRNWEVCETGAERAAMEEELRRNKSFALDMESGTICGNGLYHQVPYGAILCVSDKPLHGIPKMASMAQEFYRARMAQQFDIAWECIGNIREKGDTMHSRKLRSDFDLSPFR